MAGQRGWVGACNRRTGRNDSVSDELQGKRVAFIVANDGVEEVELTEPWTAVERAGGTAVLLAPQAGKVQAYHHLDRDESFEVDELIADADPAEFDAIVLPGGVANPDQLRTDEDAVGFMRTFAEGGRPVAAICHAPWTLIESGVVAGRRLTSWPSLKTDLRNAGATWVDDEVVVDGNLIASRNPDDLPAFCRQLVTSVGSTVGSA